MKKIVFALCMAMIVFATTGCKKDVRMYTSYYTVTPDKWISSNDLDYSYASYENADITPQVIETGCVMAYLVDSDGRDNPLPYEFFRQDGTNYYSETFSFDASVENGAGTITFKFEASDFDNATSLSQYSNLTFKVCVFENNR